jgi:hypothetical protein
MARDPITRAYRQAKRIAHAVEHPDQWLEQQFLKTLPPVARQLYRDLKHPPTPEQLVKRYLRRLLSHAKRELTSDIKRLLKVRPRPRLISPALLEPEPTPFTSTPGQDRFIEVEGHTVRVVGLPDLPPPSEYESKPDTVFAEVEQCFQNQSVMIVEQVLVHLVAKLIMRVATTDKERCQFLTVFCKDVLRCIAQHKKAPTIQ